MSTATVSEAKSKGGAIYRIFLEGCNDGDFVEEAGIIVPTISLPSHILIEHILYSNNYI